MTADNTTTAVADAQAESRARLAQLKADVEREYWASRPAPVPAFQPPPPQLTPVYEPFQHVVYQPFPTSAPAPMRRRRSIVGNLRMAWLAVKLTIAVAMLYLFALAALHEALS